MDHYSFAVFPDEDLLDLRPFQYGWEQCAPLHSFGPYVRNHYLFHYVISGRGFLDSNSMDSTSQHYDLEAGQGFLICPGQINTYGADQFQPWKYVWLEFDGMRAAKYLDEAGLNLSQPIYRPTSMEGAAQVQDALLFMAEHPERVAPPVDCAPVFFPGRADPDILYPAESPRNPASGFLHP